MKTTEASIQQKIILWFNNNYGLKHHENQCLIFSVPNETSSFMELKRKKLTGLLPGVADLIVLIPNVVLFIEVKTEKGIQSEKQKAFENKVKALGFRYEIVRSLKDFQEIVLNYKIK